MRRTLSPALLLITALLAASPVPPPREARAQASRPNILIIVTDDQRAMDTMQVMPKTQQWFGQGGTTFTNGYAATPLCCPGRSNIMSGRFAHNNGVLTNANAGALAQDSTLQAYLQGAGYTTALVGKYLNGWPKAQAPPYFDRYNVLIPQGDTYYGNEFNDNGVLAAEPAYSTNAIRNRALQYLETEFEAQDDTPWMMFVTPFAPHHPWTPGPGDENADVGTWPGNPGVFETDESDKPQYVKNAKRTYQQALETRQGQLRSLLAVDDLVDDLLTALQDQGEQDTIAFFVSDNGFQWSEHGLNGKAHAYTESIRIPFFARWPGHIAEGKNDGRFVANIDVAPTVLEATDVSPSPVYPQDGRSLLRKETREKTLNEGWTSRGPWASVRTAHYQYIEYLDDIGAKVRFREYYDLVADPYQLQNLFGDGSSRNDPYENALHRELLAVRTCSGQAGETGCSTLLDEPGIPSRCPGSANEKGHHLVGSETKDTIGGIDSRDVICGRDGKDRLRGAGARDLLLGGEGPDRIYGGAGDDVLVGKGGRDVCMGGPGKDRFRGCERRRS